ncbi:hypothetical protein R3P38DRAFT_2559080 [Favolaschia claudopus]|uniref:Chromo domain-containing protein n=1 Tax=Favolaschia claudopus TaxID=2862362 RepID=A0AAW0A5J1_9AGAR
MVREFAATELRKVHPRPVIDLKTPVNASAPSEVASVLPSQNTHTVERLETVEASSQIQSGSSETVLQAPGAAGSLAASDKSSAVEGAVADQNSEAQVDTDILWDITEVCGVQDTANGKLYECRFAGFTELEWVQETEMRWAVSEPLTTYKILANQAFYSEECDVLIAAFYQRQSEDRLDSDNGTGDPDSSSSDSSDSEAQPPRKRPRRNKSSGKQRKIVNPKGKKAALPSPISLQQTADLEALFDLVGLQTEIDSVKQARPTQGAASRLFFQASGTRTLVRDVVDACYIQARAWSGLDLVTDSPSKHASLDIAGAEFIKLTQTARALPRIASFERITSVLHRNLRSTTARAHIIIFRWCSKIGPATIKALFEIHRSNGFDGFPGHLPLGQLIDHIVQFAYSCWPGEKNAASIPSHGRFGPSHLYGLLSSVEGSKPKFITLRNPFSRRAPFHSRYSGAQKCLLDVFESAFIIPSVRQCHDFFSSTNHRSRKDNDDSVFQQALCRGAVLECLVDTCQDDGILVSDSLDAVLRNPWVYFQLGRSDRVGPALLNNASITLQPLRMWLKDHVAGNSKIMDAVKLLGNETYTILQEMTAGQAHPDTREELQSAAEQLRSHGKAARSPVKRNTRKPAYETPELEAILQGSSLPLIGLAGLLIREALSWRRDLPHQDIRLRRLLLGQPAAQSSANTDRNPDHLNPCREFNRYTELFKAHCPPEKLTGPKGLANTLAWFGTGQGVGTEQFLNTLHTSGGFWKDELAGMIQQFATASERRHMRTAPPYDNTRAWGNQPNDTLAAQPAKRVPQTPTDRNVNPGLKRNRKGIIRKQQVSAAKPKPERLTLEEKFGPMFSPEVEDAWLHLGPLANQEPRGCSPADLPSWTATLELIKSINIPAFKTGLTAMQLVNTLAFSGIVQMPTVMVMANWIADNQGLGAVAGLQLLGFKTTSKNQIRAAFICFHNYLDCKLTALDKQALGFHPPFTEHVLCKIPRWEKYLKADGCPSLSQMLEDLGDIEWISGSNAQDPSAMPFPLVPNEKDLELALEKGGEERKESVCSEWLKDSVFSIFTQDVDEHESEEETVLRVGLIQTC